jgi:biopolymer transport protein ExbD
MTVKRIVLITLLIFFCGALFAHVGIELSYASDKPRSAQTETGRVFPVTINHGSTVYVSQDELRRLHSVQTAAVYAMLASFVGIGILKLSVKDIWN